jgi:hypothetical protein
VHQQHELTPIAIDALRFDAIRPPRPDAEQLVPPPPEDGHLEDLLRLFFD